MNFLVFWLGLPAGSQAEILALGRRTGRPDCWIQWQSQIKEEDQVFCVSRQEWGARLRLDSTGTLCWVPAGPPRYRATLKNLPEEEKRVRSVVPIRRVECPSWDSRSRGKSIPLWKPWRWLLRELERSREWLSEALGEEWAGKLLRRLFLQEGESSGQLGFLRHLGFVHLLSASGIHLYWVASVCFNLGLSAVAWGGVPLRAGRLGALFLTVLVWLVGWGLAGGRLGLLRPLLIIGLRALALRLGVKWRRFSPLLLSLALDGLYRVLQGASFQGGWEYALAVGGGLLAAEKSVAEPGKEQEKKAREVVFSHLRLSLGSWLLPAIWELWHDQSVSIATPWVSLVTLPGLAGLVYPVGLLAVFLHQLGAESLAHALLHGILAFASKGLGLLLPVLVSGSWLWLCPRWVLLFAIALASISLLIPKKAHLSSLRSSRARWVSWGLVFLLALGFQLGGMGISSREARVGRGFRLASIVEQWDVGQGDAAWIRSKDGRSGLIDAGSERALSLEAWFRLMSERGIAHLDWVALTHLDEDHAGGVSRLLALVPLGCVETSNRQWETERGERLLSQLRAADVPVAPTGAGCFPFDSLAAEAVRKKHARKAAANEAMSGFLVPLASGGSYVNWGDATGDEERILAEWTRARIRASDHLRPVLFKVSHHGSRHSSSPEILERIQPERAWISCGIGNRYGHPSIEVLSALEKRAIPVDRTDQQGLLRGGVARHPR